ncbi:crotonase/enoyl-CoA hydratase family protein [Solihabitans fulvus]|uniref:Crotonase/enoyl-CoA hydratase family protein n=1 Tax=Solihabitans fulvus TaxID=1892852 RepID=A0A5B2XHN5_9PSEU|nr:crotonase/enoyl-CoA hydratase family protein [Solihabitans fulvus]KAA2262401.1 crotonase/enoyl-CoA hydratase family protein [Solihabitans fulvus]
MTDELVATGELVTTERRGHVLLIGLNRPAKRNAFTVAMLRQLAAAYGELEDSDARVGVVFAHGDHFTAGLDLAEVAPQLGDGGLNFAEDGVDPWGGAGRERTKPVVVAVQGWCLTLGIELLLAADIRIAATDTRFAQIEIQRGIYPFGGATIRFPREAGWGNAMRWLLTGDEFDAVEAHRLGLVQEVVEPGRQVDRAIELAERISEQAPLGVRATLVSARRAVVEGERAAARQLVPDLLPLFRTADAQEGVRSFVERRKAVFEGR